jgi:hypothetical protein
LSSRALNAEITERIGRIENASMANITGNANISNSKVTRSAILESWSSTSLEPHQEGEISWNQDSESSIDERFLFVFYGKLIPTQNRTMMLSW